MWKYILKRLLIMIPQLLVVSAMVFTLSKLMPGNPALQEAMKMPNVTPEIMEQLEAKYHLDENIFSQYFKWLSAAFTGDFGNSYLQQIPVTQVIGDKLYNTIFLGVFTTCTIFIIGVPLGILAGRKNGSLIDKIIVGYNYFCMAVPSFVIGIILLFVFGYRLGIFPTSGSISVDAYQAGGLTAFISKLYHVLLPGLTAGMLGTVGIIQYTRNEIIDVQLSDFVKTARSKGVGQRRLYNVHILRNSFIPVAAVLGFYITSIFAGNIFIEMVFSYPGIGQLFILSLGTRDYPVVMGITLFGASLSLLGSLLSDIILVSVDPRLRIK